MYVSYTILGAGDDVLSPGSMHITEATLNDAKATAQVHDTEEEIEGMVSIVRAGRCPRICICRWAHGVSGIEGWGGEDMS